ncbi:aquaporin AQPAn.G-like [Hydractinia symbiolongicarpus]|uniref:aquaporin AQPAn.G-like n=1 Tax=Hydractinia symbiolongicarpus TaxID=13093 RepID=UPI00254EA479|nr:aquaporin AQPAn.G-like [Hydractinia symbiolongicarpus]
MSCVINFSGELCLQNFFATTMFVFLVTSVVDASDGITQVALAIGLGASVLVQIVGPISGAHFNPAVTIGVFLNQGCSFWKLLFTFLRNLLEIMYTGCGINPARAFGPAVVFNFWVKYHWIYWLGPYIGSILSGLLYRFVFGVEDTNPTIQVQETNQYVNVAE